MARPSGRSRLQPQPATQQMSPHHTNTSAIRVNCDGTDFRVPYPSLDMMHAMQVGAGCAPCVIDACVHGNERTAGGQCRVRLHVHAWQPAASTQAGV